MNEKYRPIDRKPDVETPSFDLWQTSGEEQARFSPLITIGEGEELHESRIYRSTFEPGYELLIISKKKGDEYWFACKGKRPDGHTFVKSGLKGPLSLSEYNNDVKMMEAAFAVVFDTENPQVTSGKHYMLYMRGRKV